MTISEVMTRHPAIGVVTDRDLALRAVAPGLAGSTPVRRVMSTEPVSVADDATVLDAAQQMAIRGCRRLPVVDRGSGRLVGIVTLDDVLVSAGDTLDQVIRLLNAERHEHADLATVLRRRQVA